MVRTLITWCLHQRWVVLGLSLGLMMLGARAASEASFDAFPEFAPPRVEVQVEAPGMSSEEVEALITAPLEHALAGTSGLTQLRSKSVLGMASVVLLFAPHSDLLQARALVQERLARAAGQLPQLARAPVMLSPLSSTSRVMKIGIWSRAHTQMELTDLVRWTVRPKLMSIPGVANVAIWGERDRQLQVKVDPARLAAHGVGLERVISTTRAAVTPRAGGFIDSHTQRTPVTHPPLVRDASDLARVPLQGVGTNQALTLGQVADVVEGPPPAIGAGLVTQGPGLLLIVEKQRDGNTLEITRQVDAALAALAPGLPGIDVDATIFRPASFIERALHNLREALNIGCVLVILVLVLFLWDARTALVSVTALPLSLFAATAVLCGLGYTIDTMVIAGLALALGEVVDDAIIDVENIHRRLAVERDLSFGERIETVVRASLEVRSAIVYASVIVLMLFLPLLAVDGAAGEFFRPLALAYGLAVLASTFVALTITPTLAFLLLPRRQLGHRKTPFAAFCLRRYTPLLMAALRHPRRVVLATISTLLVTGIAFASLREEFLPAFQESDFLMHWIARPGTSLEGVTRSAELARVELLEVPGVRNFGAHIGRAELGDEVVGPNFAELWISVDPRADLAATMARVRGVVEGIPGVYRDVQTYLQERMREVLSGGSGAIVVRLYGQDLAVLKDSAARLGAQLEQIEGVAHARPEAHALVPQLEIAPNLERCAALGIDPGAVRAQASSLVQGERVGQLVRGLQTIDVMVVGHDALRADVSALHDLVLPLDDQRSVRLADIADLRIMPMQNTIAHDAGSRKLDVVVDLAVGADLGQIARAIAAKVRAFPFAAAHHAELLGEYRARTQAQTKLAVVSALALFGVALVLLADFRSLRLALLVIASLPFALVGGVFATICSHGMVSLGTLVGLVTVIGIAARNGIMLIAHYRYLESHEGVPFGSELVLRGACERLAPILMTALATALALVPLVFRGAAPGHEIEYPMAVVILGGVISSTLLNLFVMPVLYLQFGRAATAVER